MTLQPVLKALNLLRYIFKEHFTIIMTTKEMAIVISKERFQGEHVPSASKMWLFTFQTRYISPPSEVKLSDKLNIFIWVPGAYESYFQYK